MLSLLSQKPHVNRYDMTEEIRTLLNHNVKQGKSMYVHSKLQIKNK